MSLIKSLGISWTHCDRVEARRPARPNILAITPDDRFYSLVLYVSTQSGWTTNWARSIGCALAAWERHRDSVVLYDCHSPSESWQVAAGRLMAANEKCCIVLAAQDVDQCLWDLARRHRVYDVVSRTGHTGHLAATLRFAWEWKTGRERRFTDSPSSIGCPHTANATLG